MGFTVMAGSGQKRGAHATSCQLVLTTIPYIDVIDL